METVSVCSGIFFGGEGVEELILSYTIELDTRTKKNHMTIAGTGPKCPKCGKKARQFVRQGRANTEYSMQAAHFLMPRPKKPLEGPVHLVYKVYTQTKRVVDDLNLYASLDDILVKEGVLKDDNRNIIRSRDRSRVHYDKERPRAEIYIYNYEEEEEDGTGNEDVHRGQVSGTE